MPHAFYIANISLSAAFRYAHPRSPDEPTTLHVFDYCTPGTGRILIYERWLGGRIFKPDRIEILPSSSNLLPLYARLIAIGGTDPQSVTQLHFFTHGNPELGVVGGPRGEDSRAKWEQILPLGSERRERFRSAFTPNAVLKLWGCGIQPEAKRLTLSYWRTGSAQRRAAIQAQVEARIRGTYALRLSETIDQTVWAVPPGWKSAMDLPQGATYFDLWDEASGPVPNSMWWRVSSDFVGGRGAEFYRRVLGASIDAVGYVGVNHDMSTAKPPETVLKAEAPEEDTAIGHEAYPQAVV